MSKFNLCLPSRSGYSFPASAKSEVRGDSLNTRADNNRYNHVRFFCVRKPSYASMVGRSGGAYALAGSSSASLSTPLRLITTFDSVAVRLQNLTREAVTMTTTPTQTHPKFIWRFHSPRNWRRVYVIAATEAEARTKLHKRHKDYLLSASLPLPIAEGVYQVKIYADYFDGSRKSFLLPDMFNSRLKAEYYANEYSFEYQAATYLVSVTCEVLEVAHV